MTDDITIDEISNLATCSVSLKWQELETVLGEAGYTLGFYNPKKARASLRELLARNGPNLFYRQYGQPIEWCVSVRCRGAKNIVYQTKRVPRSAAGPDFRRILLRSGRRYAALEEVTLRLHPVPERVDWHWSYWPTTKDAEGFIREIEAIDVTPSFAGVYPVEKQPRALRHAGKILTTLRFAGLSGLVANCVDRAGAVMRRQGGETIRLPRQKIVPFFKKLIGES
jgi:FAD/FMN-containing dehydrogenase